MNAMHLRLCGPTAIAAMSGAIMLAACAGDPTGSAARQMSLSFTTKSTAAVRASTGISRDIAVGPAGELVLKNIQLVIGQVELSRSDGAACSDDAEGDDDTMRADDDCESMTRNPILVNVPVDDAVHTVVSVPVPEGTFTKLEAKLGPAAASTIAALGAPADMADRSVRVEGTFKGVPFVFTSPIRTTLELRFNPPLVVDATTKNATVNIDVTRWFVAANGTVIDPATANAGGSNAQLVASNIRNSFEAFEDDDKGGDDDHAASSGSGRDH